MPTPFMSDAEIAAIAAGLFARTLPKPAWTHQAHFAAALWVLARPGLVAETVLPPAIRAYNAATGVANTPTGGFHYTITLASIAAARGFLAAHPGPLHAVGNALMASHLGRPDWLLAYWSPEVLFSAAARRAWVGPDRCAFVP